MNLFWRELRAHRKSLIFWCLGMVFLVGSSVAKFATFSSSGQSISEFLGQLPKSIQVIFGMTGFNLDEVSGYMGVTFMYIALMATAHAVLLGSSIISKEERDRTSEFLMTKPISRFAVVIYKVSAGMVDMISLNFVTLLSCIYFASYFSKSDSANSYIILLMTGLFILQLIFFFVGTTVSAIKNKSKSAPSVATSILLVTFILTVFINLNSKLDSLKYLTPFKYFNAKDLLVNGKLEANYVIISVILLIFMTILTFVFYRRRDLNV